MRTRSRSAREGPTHHSNDQPLQSLISSHGHPKETNRRDGHGAESKKPLIKQSKSRGSHERPSITEGRGGLEIEARQSTSTGTDAGKLKRAANSGRLEAPSTATNPGRHKRLSRAEANSSSLQSLPPEPKKRAKADVTISKAAHGADSPKSCKKRKRKKDMAVAAWPSRSTKCPKLLGAHVSIGGGVDGAWSNANEIGANSLAFFVKNQRQWASKPLSPQTILQFRSNFDRPLPPEDRGYNSQAQIVVHGSYLVNLANPDPDRHGQALAGYLDDLQKCEALDIGFLNIHPGSTCGKCEKSVSISQIARAIDKGHTVTEKVVTLLETMAGRGNLIGGTFQELRQIIDEVKDKTRIGVCLDTCHVFAAGYDIRDNRGVQEMLVVFDRVIGLPYLKALHLNDSKGAYRSHRDLHENIGFGQIGLEGFHALMNATSLDGLPCILETPPREPSFWLSEIQALESLCGLKLEDLEVVRSMLQSRGPSLKDAQSARKKHRRDSHAANAIESADGASSSAD